MQSVLIGVPSFKRPDRLRACLESLALQKGAKVSVHVADNDPEHQEARSVVAQIAPDYPFPLSVEVVSEPGISAPRNAILAAARGFDFIAMIDDDETASPNWLSSLLETQRSGAFDVVGGPVEPRYEREPDKAILRSRAFDALPNPDGPIAVIWGTGNCLVSTRLLERLGWPTFDLAFSLTGCEDRDWFTRLSKSGATFAWSQAAVAYEHIPIERMKTGWILRRNFRNGVDDMRMARRHGGAAQWTRYLIEAGAIASTTPISALALVPFRTRLRVLRAWSKALGRFSGAVGLHFKEYGRSSN